MKNTFFLKICISLDLLSRFCEHFIADDLRFDYRDNRRRATRIINHPFRLADCAAKDQRTSNRTA